MGSRALSLLRTTNHGVSNSRRRSSFSKSSTQKWVRNYSVRSGLEPLDVPRLAETARISLPPGEVEEIAPKIRQVLDWFGQLQEVDLQSIEPVVRAGLKQILRMESKWILIIWKMRGICFTVIASLLLKFVWKGTLNIFIRPDICLLKGCTEGVRLKIWRKQRINFPFALSQLALPSQLTCGRLKIWSKKEGAKHQVFLEPKSSRS
ncbi:uncharacterized protein LOC132282491 isoform X2 [Cornus florida]|uniref:uncharacterized protein LOC132282491 isoform X2 n=1 Tax=Cornus florida TaxID=4283 RepID=UPI002897485E|nr:uncharacterized protein LOC132282491 isoform X2 [Cornus florida]